MIKVCSTQFSYHYGSEIRLPYAIAILLSYCRFDIFVRQNYKFAKTFLFRDKINEYLEDAKDCSILLCSDYVWNHEINLFFAKKVRELNPECFILFGGPNISKDAHDFLKQNSFIDVVVHGEGEIPLKELLHCYVMGCDLSTIKGIEAVDFNNGIADRIDNLDSIPSPYLDNFIWELVEQRKDSSYIASWETNRGCPYECAFCDWGGYLGSKIRIFSEERILKEINWFAENKIDYIDCCDANFGILFDRDYRTAQRLKEVKSRTGFPRRIRPAWTKQSSEKIIAIAKELKEVDLLKGVTIDLQSMNDTVLENINRRNIKFDSYSKITELFKQNNIPTYTELILGLPGETLKSFKDGLEKLLSESSIGSLYIYNCNLFPNAPMNEEEYKKKFDIKVMRSPIYLTHSDINFKERNLIEYEDIVIGSYSYTIEDLKQMFLYGWMAQVFFSLGIMEHIAKYYYCNFGTLYMKFCDLFCEYCEKNKKNIFSEEYRLVKKYIEDGYNQKGWDHFDWKLGSIYWSIEEASWLRFILDINDLKGSIHDFLYFVGYEKDENILEDLINFQIFLLTTPEKYDIVKTSKFKNKWKQYFENDCSQKIINEEVVYNYDNLVVENNEIEWNYKTMWYGRAMKKYKVFVENLREE